ncbi:MAG: ORF6N domain-containing protein [Candidatus Aminicenantes bacterium]|jgi:hypothetical protein
MKCVSPLLISNGVTTKALNQAVKRNRDIFPQDFVFQLNKKEKIELVTNCDHLSRLKYSATLLYENWNKKLKNTTKPFIYWLLL